MTTPAASEDARWAPRALRGPSQAGSFVGGDGESQELSVLGGAGHIQSVWWFYEQ